MILDRGPRIDVFITFNPGDFSDVCARCRMLMLSQQGSVQCGP